MNFEERRRKCTDRLEADTVRHLHNVQTILDWSAEMHRRGLMPDDVARAFEEVFRGDDVCLAPHRH
jgi:hypothetical protein